MRQGQKSLLIRLFYIDFVYLPPLKYIKPQQRPSMKFLRYTLTALTIISFNVIFAQNKQIEGQSEQSWEANIQMISDDKSLEKQNLVVDTLFPETFQMECGLTLVNFFSNGGGVIGGNNAFFDIEKAQRFTYNEADCFGVTLVAVFFGYVDLIGDGNIRVKIYERDPNTNGPGNLVGTSDDLSVSEINIDSALAVPTFFTFPTPPKVNGNEFFVSVDFIDLYTSQDTVGILMSPAGCGDGADSWELFGDGVTWLNIDDQGSWQLESNFFMGVIIDTDVTTSIDEVALEESGLESFQIFPNPVSLNTNVSFNLKNSSQVDYEIFSLDGSRIMGRSLGSKSAGYHIETINVSTIPSGKYILSFQTEQGRISDFIDITH